MAGSKTSNSLDRLDPQERLKILINYSNLVEVDPHVPPKKYYRSGLEMVRMANVYYDEGSLENAYVLYLKFMTLFVEKIRKHPDFHSVPAEIKAINQARMREILPRAENLRKKLLEQYREDHEVYLAEIRKKEREERERRQRDKERQKREEKQRPAPPNAANFITARVAGKIDDVSYPDPNIASVPPPTKTTEIQPPPYELHQEGSLPSLPSVDRTKKPSDIENYDREILRPVVVPTKVMVLFQTLAQPNTVKNVETCAVLAGKLEKNELFITHMILPKQSGTSDSCTTLNEEEIFDYQDQHNLITIGWIHTHPTQTAFLSSVDLHTHCSYQLLMPEALAIVCSPKYNDTGYFILTPHYGLQYIANCRKSGFHPHPTEPPLFKVADHVRIDANAPLEVLDLRRM